MTSCATAQEGGSVKESLQTFTQTKSATIKPNRSYEDCIEIQSGQTLEYSFTADKPIHFNIHYHGEDGIEYPVNKKKISELSGELKVGGQPYYIEGNDDFCLMWQNPHDTPVDSTCTITIK
jgi:hypothetical protein